MDGENSKLARICNIIKCPSGPESLTREQYDQMLKCKIKALLFLSIPGKCQ